MNISGIGFAEAQAHAVTWLLGLGRASMTKVRVGRGKREASSLLWSVQLLMSAPVWRHTSRTDAPFGPARPGTLQ